MKRHVHVLGVAIAASVAFATAAPAAQAASSVAGPVSPVAVGVGARGLPWECNLKAVEPSRQPDSVLGLGTAVCTGDYAEVQIEACVARAWVSTGTVGNYVPGFADQDCALAELAPGNPLAVALPKAGCPPLARLLTRSDQPTAQSAAGAPWVTYVRLFGGAVGESLVGNVSGTVWIPDCGSFTAPISA